MAIKFKIVIPSKGRPSDVRKTALFPLAHIAVPARELEEYQSVKGVAPAAWVPVPDEVNSLSKTRQWILDELWSKDEEFVFQTDDDLIALVYMMSRTVRYYNDPEYIRAVIGHVGVCAVDSGAGLFGFATQPKPNERKANTPFVLRKWISAQGIGIVDRELEFDPALILKEDLEISLANLQKNRIAWVDDRWCFYSEHWKNMGGLVQVRTEGRELAAFNQIQDKYGQGIVKRQEPMAKKDNKLLKGAWSMSLNLG
jgi:hypothetical protein